MGNINQPTNLTDRVVQLERNVEAIRKLAGLTSAIISRGGLTLLEDSFIKMVDSNQLKRLYIGHTSEFESFDQPVFYLFDHLGNIRFGLYDPAPVSDGYQPVLWVWDHLGNIVMTSDKNGGMAEPWISVPIYPRAFPSTVDSLDTQLTVPVSACSGGVVWEGRIGKVSHPRIQYEGIFGRATGVSGNPTYTFSVGGVVVDTFSQTGFQYTTRGPFDISQFLGFTGVPVLLKISATGTGTDRVSAHPVQCWMRQT